MRALLLLLTPALLAPVSHAQEAMLPPPVRAMVEAAAESGDKAKIDAVVTIAKETHPDAADEIDAIASTIAARKEAERLEAMRTAGPLDNWKGRAELGGSISTGNNDVRNFALGLNLLRDGISWRHRLEAAADFQSSAGTRDQERILAAWQSDWKMTERFYLWGRFGYERNFDAGITRRFIESAGLGWRALARPNLSWDLEGGPALQQTLFADGSSDNSLAFRGASRFGWDLSERTRLANDTFLLLDGASSLNNTLAVSTMLFASFSAGVSFTVLWEEEPAPGLQSTSTITRFTLGYNF
jgi:putative salt-induced outer membrane protein